MKFAAALLAFSSTGLALSVSHAVQHSVKLAETNQLDESKVEENTKPFLDCYAIRHSLNQSDTYDCLDKGYALEGLYGNEQYVHDKFVRLSKRELLTLTDEKEIADLKEKIKDAEAKSATYNGVFDLFMDKVMEMDDEMNSH